MLDIASYERELKKRPGGEKLMEAANSEEGRRLAKLLDPADVEKAAREGDAEALKGILAKVLSTPDGMALAQKLSKAMREK